MNGKRYFYTDPLAGAWMAKHFGMLFEDWEGASMWGGNLDSFSIEIEHNILGEGKYYIHPDSLYLLKPHIGDVVKKESHRQISEGQSLSWYEILTPLSAISYSKIKAITQTIQRNGIAFMWPEAEDIEQ